MYGQIRIVPVHQPETMSFWNSYPILNIIPSDDAARSFIHTQYHTNNIYIYTHMCVCMYVYMYVYIYYISIYCAVFMCIYIYVGCPLVIRLLTTSHSRVPPRPAPCVLGWWDPNPGSFAASCRPTAQHAKIGARRYTLQIPWLSKTGLNLYNWDPSFKHFKHSHLDSFRADLRKDISSGDPACTPFSCSFLGFKSFITWAET